VRLIICSIRIYPWFKSYVSLKRVEPDYVIMEIDNSKRVTNY
jgi:hypothetical protein